ncbi:MAG: hypothetical protein M3128_07360, partial [Verrucomicrobiota bacterium]|nr:hypothetical protein [Verrucomicrobiota bacterium]
MPGGELIATNVLDGLRPLLPAAYYVLIGIGAFTLGAGIIWLLSRQKSALAVAECEASMNKQTVDLAQCLATAQEKNSRIPELESNLTAAKDETKAYRDQHAKAT